MSFIGIVGFGCQGGPVSLSLEDQTHRTQIKGEIAHLVSLEEISWRQKSRFLFVKEGDNNTHFFHWVANSHRRTNYLRGIEVDGVLYENEEEVRSKVVHFYQSLYTKDTFGTLNRDYNMNCNLYYQ